MATSTMMFERRTYACGDIIPQTDTVRPMWTYYIYVDGEECVRDDIDFQRRQDASIAMVREVAELNRIYGRRPS